MNKFIHAPANEKEEEALARMRVRTRRSFLVGGAAAVASVGGYAWLSQAHQVGQLQWPLRAAEHLNAGLFRGILREKGMAPAYPLERATTLRVNGDIGMSNGLVLDSWRLQIVGLERPEQHKHYVADVDTWEYHSADDAVSAPEAPAQPNAKQTQPDAKQAQPDAKQAQQDTKQRSGGAPHLDLSMTVDGAGDVKEGKPEAQKGANTQASTASTSAQPAGSEAVTRYPGVLLSMADLRSFPWVEMVTEFKCIEGWSQVVRWGGVRFSEVLRAFPPKRTSAGLLPRYVAMETPDGSYTASFDLASLMNPQTLLCFAMGGAALSPEHGAPLRLVMPLKYGYKQIKQIAKITYTDTRPQDFWEVLGYDWYAGL